MMNKIRKFFMLAIGAAFCLVFVASAPAFEGASLQSQTTFSLFEDDPFDLSIDPGVLYQVDRWRLYTNLSNYETEDGAYYLIGTSGKLGAGSLAFFYETSKNEIDENDLDADNWLGIERLSGTSYTGTNDTVITTYDSRSFKDEEEASNFYLSYSMDFGTFSIGAAYNPEFEDRTVSLQRGVAWNAAIGGMNLGGIAPVYNPAAWAGPGHEENLDQGAVLGWNAANITGNFSRRQVTTTYGTVDHSKYNIVDTSDSFTGENDIEDKSHGFTVSSLIRPADKFEVQVTAGLTTIDTEVGGSATYTYSRTDSDTGTTAPATDLVPGLALVDGYCETETQTSTWNGNFLDGDEYNHDGTKWGLEIEPGYELNEVVTLTLRLGYETADGDANGDWTQNVNIDRSITTNAADTTPETWEGTQVFDNTWSGDWEQNSYIVEPRVYLTYGPVDFSLGVAYSSEKEEVSGRTRNDATYSWSYENGDGAKTALDWTCAGSYTSYADWNFETKETAWSFPVATRFKVTDKLTLRAGARFSRTTTEMDETDSFAGTDDDKWTITDGTDTVVAAGANGYVDAAGLIQPYDATHETARTAESHETTIDTTDYSLGLGYQVTEHLVFDLMFKGEQDSRGGVDTETVWASVTLAF